MRDQNSGCLEIISSRTERRNMFMRILFVVIIIVVVIAAVIYFFGGDIFQYSAEKVLKQNLPPYVHVDKLAFDLKERRMTLEGLRIDNPEGFSKKHLARIAEINCRYRMRGGNILDGIEVTRITASKPVINIERLSGGRINVNEMEQLMKKTDKPAVSANDKGNDKAAMKISDLVKLTETINVLDGSVVFTDHYVSRPPYKITFENVNGDIQLKLNDDYTGVLFVKSRGTGYIDGQMRQQIDWVVSFDPTASALTMSNRFEVKGIDITQFEPYYDEYSPINIQRGTCSGTLVFDFDRGNIGSMNTIVIKGLRFTPKEGGTAFSAWQQDIIPEMIKYLQSNPDEVTFDFKIKGPMDNPRFYPGPTVKQAIQNMAIDKVSDVIKSFGKEEGESAGQSDTDKVIDVIKGLMNK
ncbi:MAG: DUF748 domain-containing protein [Candidatus Omnitrophica bacterium]|nr:DUF748 domain-containing protein [Candidatus Omnitrophota bacterium]